MHRFYFSFFFVALNFFCGGNRRNLGGPSHYYGKMNIIIKPYMYIIDEHIYMYKVHLKYLRLNS